MKKMMNHGNISGNFCTSARSAAASCCCNSSVCAFSFVDAALLASILLCLRLSLRLSILAIALYIIIIIIILVWKAAPGGKHLLQGE